ncbi:MAG: SRPBCC family protein [Gemmatimonadaceae bacterium]
MSQVARTTVIKNSPQRVIDYIADVGNHTAFIGPLKAVSGLTGDPRKPGTAWTWTFFMAGVEFTGSAETVSYAAGRQFSYKTTSGILSTFTYSCEAGSEKETKLKMEVSYEIPKTLLAKMQTGVIEKLNDAEGDRVVQNIKAILDE